MGWFNLKRRSKVNIVSGFMLDPSIGLRRSPNMFPTAAVDGEVVIVPAYNPSVCSLDKPLSEGGRHSGFGQYQWKVGDLIRIEVWDYYLGHTSVSGESLTPQCRYGIVENVGGEVREGAFSRMALSVRMIGGIVDLPEIIRLRSKPSHAVTPAEDRALFAQRQLQPAC